MGRPLVERIRPWWSVRIPEEIATEAALRRSRAMLWWAVAFAAAFIAVYVLFVWTRNGQRWDDAAWYGYKVQDGDYLLAAKDKLRTISLDALVVSSALLCLIVWFRFGLRDALVVGLFLVLTLVTAEVLKHWILPRPEFYDFDPLEKAHNTLPSGHTTIGAMVGVGLILAMPRQVRGLVTIAAFWFAAEIGGSTLAAGWHRPSDAMAAYLLVGLATCLVVGLMLRRGSARLLGRDDLGRLRGWSPFVWVIPVLGALLLWGSVAATLQEWPLIVGDEPITSWTVPQLDRAFTAGLLADYAFAAIVFTLVYLMLRRVEMGVSREDWRRWHRRHDAELAFAQLPEVAAEEPASQPARRLPDVTLLPDVTSDESGPRESFSDDYYLSQRPPHHGD